jgi:hypothetical protein
LLSRIARFALMLAIESAETLTVGASLVTCAMGSTATTTSANSGSGINSGSGLGGASTISGETTGIEKTRP